VCYLPTQAAISKTPPPAAPELLATILDILRYTVVFPTHRYTSSVREMIHALKQHQYKQHRVKNYWGPGDGYQGINAVFVAPSGQAFELQFHTPESLSMKEEECHSSYAKFCAAKDSRKMMQYWEEMISMWDLVPVPEDVLEIPQVVQQKLEFDLSRLSEEETAAIQHRKSLEHVCRYHVDELHARAVKAEAEIRALMVYLMHKHAPGKESKRCTVAESVLIVSWFVCDFQVGHASRRRRGGPSGRSCRCCDSWWTPSFSQTSRNWTNQTLLSILTRTSRQIPPVVLCQTSMIRFVEVRARTATALRR
jgi:hypothetical protein